MSVSSLLMTSSAVPVEHLDYSYIQQCGDVKYLEKILQVLRSGREGVYPHLTEYCEKQMEMLEPRHQALRKEAPPTTAASFTTDQWTRITDELQAWQREIKEREQQLIQRPTLSSHTVPPVLNRIRQKPTNTNQHSTSSSVPREYSQWDRFDVDAECAKIDKVVNLSAAPVVINNPYTQIRQQVDTSALTMQEKSVLATREKEKGNEAFRAREWAEAIVYYTRSLCILPTVSGFNNRAQAEIQLHRWTDALRDCDAALDKETNNCKALLRRATVYTHLDKLQAAQADIRNVLQLEPHNITAQKLLQEVSKKMNLDLSHTPSLPHQSMRGRKIQIQEVDDKKMEESKDAETIGVNKQTQRDTGRETGRQTEIKTDRQTVKQTDGVIQCVDAAAVRSEGNELYRKGQYGDAAEKYTHGITTLTQLGVYSKEELFILYTNRAACFLKTGQSFECVSDCYCALQLKPFSVKTLLRRAMAYETLEQFRLAYVDYRTVQQIHNIHSVQQCVNRLTKVLMEEDGSNRRTKLPVGPLSALHDYSETQTTPPNTQTPPNTVPPPTKLCPHTVLQSVVLSGLRRRIKIVEVEDDGTDDDDGDDDDGGLDEDDAAVVENDDDYSNPENVFMFGQALYTACCHGDFMTCMRLLKSVSPHTLPQHISTQLDTHILSRIIHTLHKHILPTDPAMVYHILTHLHTIDRFRMVLMLMDSDERMQITQLFECLCAVECDEFIQENINNLAKYFQ